MADPLEKMYETNKKPIYNYLYRCTYNSRGWERFNSYAIQ